ncbi:MAG TPA: CotO family spore coat protein [Pseudogracilibacillus sp.]|nr:CotO family spore coat protein [Pseudogracilibacillus sp.]
MKQLAHNEPLLYINQPSLSKPKSYMQTEFDSKGESLAKTRSENKETLQTSFKQLSIDEKINYLVTLPSELFQMKCQVKTENKTYYGMIKGRDEQAIEMIHTSRQHVKIPIPEIRSIHLLGL